ncbi:GNAT family N-acetyltransferase [Oceanirhabdus sp. W0125-5]|uniref:GNAT family N-acetyltransferase n=1 Tax=Oceanirhabdus sp. W0125-5 TaxID=2999116 RepID=UPI0022F340F0|nr:GNAT family N-acetyltransferase [Oceanirhabdus sp. W0125-5]WBW96658.1 GNAT family N-acetyltransferase [Oceanirhabdus sp. W0125-5]
MGFEGVKQPMIIDINQKLRLKNSSEVDWKLAEEWYKNEKILYYSEGIKDGRVYNLDTINKMYTYLSNIGEMYFIEYFENGKWIPIGDATLSDQNMPIIIGDEAYWGMRIGKLVIGRLLKRAREIGIKKITIPAIYKYNARSRNLFTSFGFRKISENEGEETFELEL